MDKKELNDLIDRIGLTGPGGVDKIKKILKELVNGDDGGSGGDEGGGCDCEPVEANPTIEDGDVTTPLEALKVGNNIYSVSGSGGSVPPAMVVEGNITSGFIDNSGAYMFSPKSGEATFQEAKAQLDAGGILYLKVDFSNEGQTNLIVYNGRFSVMSYDDRTMYSIIQSTTNGRSYAIVWQIHISFDIDFESPDVQLTGNSPSLSAWFIDYNVDIFIEDNIVLNISNAPTQDGEAQVVLELMDNDTPFFSGSFEGNGNKFYSISLVDATSFTDMTGEDVPDSCDYVIVVIPQGIS